MIYNNIDNAFLRFRPWTTSHCNLFAVDTNFENELMN